MTIKNCFQQVIVLSTCILISTISLAENTHTQHDAHQHGVVELNIAQDNQQLMLELIAPGNDILGFEYAPKTPAEKQTLVKALHILQNPLQLFSIDESAKCKLQSTSINDKFVQKEEHEKHHEEPNEEHHENEEEDHQHEEKPEHGSVYVEYNFHCANIDKLQQIKTAWFLKFPNSEKIKVQLISSSSQDALYLDKQNNTIAL